MLAKTDLREPIEDVYVQLGATIMQHRLRRGWSQLELANRMALSRASIANVETGRQRLMLHQIQAAAVVFDVSLSDILDLPELTPTARIASLKEKLAEAQSECARLSSIIKIIREASERGGGE